MSQPADRIPSPSARVTAWSGQEAPSEAAIRKLLAAEGLSGQRWGNGPLDVYLAHQHAYNKVIYVVSGSITFSLPQEGTRITMTAGDRLDLPAGTLHEAVVSTQGVECLEAHWTTT